MRSVRISTSLRIRKLCSAAMDSVQNRSAFASGFSSSSIQRNTAHSLPSARRRLSRGSTPARRSASGRPHARSRSRPPEASCAVRRRPPARTRPTSRELASCRRPREQSRPPTVQTAETKGHRRWASAEMSHPHRPLPSALRLPTMRVWQRVALPAQDQREDAVGERGRLNGHDGDLARAGHAKGSSGPGQPSGSPSRAAMSTFRSSNPPHPCH